MENTPSMVTSLFLAAETAPVIETMDGVTYAAMSSPPLTATHQHIARRHTLTFTFIRILASHGSVERGTILRATLRRRTRMPAVPSPLPMHHRSLHPPRAARPEHPRHQHEWYSPQNLPVHRRHNLHRETSRPTAHAKTSQHMVRSHRHEGEHEQTRGTPSIG